MGRAALASRGMDRGGGEVVFGFAGERKVFPAKAAPTITVVAAIRGCEVT